jgi:tellurite resistance protein TerC
MVSIPGVSPWIMWIGFLVLIFIFLFLDLGIFNKKKHMPSIKEALMWTGIWISMSLLFNVFVWLEFGGEVGLQFLGGYLLEKALSVDNIFVMFLIFTHFQIPGKYQHKILFWGIIGALIMRGILIGAGTALVSRFHWIFYIFGAFLIYSGIKMLFSKDEEYDPHDSKVVKCIHKIVPVARDHKNGKMWVRENGKFAITILMVTLIMIEFTDVVFAFDSIPAIFGITTDPFIVFTSNIFAILGLRSLYFVIAQVHDIFVYLNYGLSVILVFIGAKMLLERWIEVSLAVSLGVVFSILAISIIASITLGKKSGKKATR